MGTNRVITGELWEDGTPKVAVCRDDKDTISVDDKWPPEIDDVEIHYTYHEDDETLYSWCCRVPSKLRELLDYFEELKPKLEKEIMDTGYYKGVEVRLDQNLCDIRVTYYGFPTIEDVVQAKERARRTVDSYRIQMDNLQAEYDKAKALLDNTGEGTNE